MWVDPEVGVCVRCERRDLLARPCPSCGLCVVLVAGVWRDAGSGELHSCALLEVT